MNRLFYDVYRDQFDYVAIIEASIDLAIATCANFSPNGNLLLIGAATGDIIIWDMISKSLLMRLPSIGAPVISLSASACQIYILASCSDGSVARYNLVTGKMEYRCYVPVPIRWSIMCPSNPDLCLVSPLFGSSLLINIAMEPQTPNEHIINYSKLKSNQEVDDINKAYPSRFLLSSTMAYLPPKTTYEQRLIGRQRGQRQQTQDGAAPSQSIDSSHMDDVNPVTRIGMMVELQPHAHPSPENLIDAYQESITAYGLPCFATFSPDGSEIAVGTQRGHYWSVKLDYAPIQKKHLPSTASPTPSPPPPPPTLSSLDGNPYQLSTPITFQRIEGTSSHDIDTSMGDSADHANEHAFLHPQNGIKLVHPRLHIYRLTKAVVQLQYSPHNLVAVCSEDGSVAVYHGEQHNYEIAMTFRDTFTRTKIKKAVFSPLSTHLYTLLIRETHTIYVTPLNVTPPVSKVLNGPSEGVYDISAHPYLPIVVSITAAGRVLLWGRQKRESWSAFSPGFQEFSENLEYRELEDEFDINTYIEKPSQLLHSTTNDYDRLPPQITGLPHLNPDFKMCAYDQHDECWKSWKISLSYNRPPYKIDVQPDYILRMMATQRARETFRNLIDVEQCASAFDQHITQQQGTFDTFPGLKTASDQTPVPSWALTFCLKHALESTNRHHLLDRLPLAPTEDPILLDIRKHQIAQRDQTPLAHVTVTGNIESGGGAAVLRQMGSSYVGRKAAFTQSTLGRGAGMDLPLPRVILNNPGIRAMYEQSYIHTPQTDEKKQ